MNSSIFDILHENKTTSGKSKKMLKQLYELTWMLLQKLESTNAYWKSL